MNEKKHTVDTEVSTQAREHMNANADEAQAKLTTPRIQAMVVSRQTSNKIRIANKGDLSDHQRDHTATTKPSPRTHERAMGKQQQAPLPQHEHTYIYIYKHIHKHVYICMAGYIYFLCKLCTHVYIHICTYACV